MNWITLYYQDALAREHGIFNLDFWFEPLIYLLAALCICALAYRRPGKKRLGVALGVAIVFALVDPLAYQPLVAFDSLPERIRTLSGDPLHLWCSGPWAGSPCSWAQSGAHEPLSACSLAAH